MYENLGLVCVLDRFFINEIDLKFEITPEGLCGEGGDKRYIGNLEGSIYKALHKRLNYTQYLKNEISSLDHEIQRLTSSKTELQKKLDKYEQDQAYLMTYTTKQTELMNYAKP
jgi:hypothetical protein